MLPSRLKQTILLCYKQADQQSLDLVQVEAHDIRAFTASKAFYGGVWVDQILQTCHWKAHNTFTIFYLKDLTWSDNDINMYLRPVVDTVWVSYEVDLGGLAFLWLSEAL